MRKLCLETERKRKITYREIDEIKIVQEMLQSKITELERQPTRMSRLQNFVDHAANMRKQGFYFEKDCLEFVGDIFSNHAFVLFKKEVVLNEVVEVDFVKIDIDQMVIYSQPSKVISLEAIFYKKNKFIEIIDMFTEEKYRRQGHGRYMIDKLKVYQHDKCCVKAIYGDLQKSTPIGINNLNSFYKKQGFTVSEKDFIIHLN